MSASKSFRHQAKRFGNYYDTNIWIAASGRCTFHFQMK